MILYPSRFIDFVKATIYFEVGNKKNGGYTNDPHDAGGETKWGISKRAYPNLDIKELTYEKAIEIYYQDYYNNVLDELENEQLAFKIFDMSVLRGKRKAIKLLQSAINSFIKSHITEDGKLGLLTLGAIKIIDSRALYERYKQKLEDSLRLITIVRPQNIKYLKGWLKRVGYDYKKSDFANYKPL